MISILQLSEQPDVLDGDDCLIRKCFQESNLLIRKGTYLLAANHDGADRYAFAKQWSRKYGPRAGKTEKFRRLCKFGFRLRRNVMDVNGFAIDHRSPYRHAASDR